MLLFCVAAAVPVPQGWRSPFYAPRQSGRLGEHVAVPASASAGAQLAPQTLLLQARPVEGAVGLSDMAAPQLPCGAGLQLPGGQALALLRPGVAASPSLDQQPQQAVAQLVSPTDSLQPQSAAQLLQQLLASPGGPELLQQALGRPGGGGQGQVAPTSAGASLDVPVYNLSASA